MWAYSATQLAMYRECPRKYAYTYDLGLKPDQTDAQRYGEEIHEALERYVLTGEIPEDPRARVALDKIYGEQLWPEGRLHLDLPFDARVTGRIDLVSTHGSMVMVTDYKTTKMEKYILSEEQLRTNVQAVIYARFVLTRMQIPSVRVRWLYLITTGPARTREVSATLTAGEVALAWDGIVQELEALHTARTRDAESLPIATNGTCHAYGGCPFLSRCDTWFAAAAQESEMGLAEELAAARERNNGGGTPLDDLKEATLKKLAEKEDPIAKLEAQLAAAKAEKEARAKAEAEAAAAPKKTRRKKKTEEGAASASAPNIKIEDMYAFRRVLRQLAGLDD